MFLRKGILKICNKFTGETPMPKCDFNNVVYWNRTSTWMFSCKFVAYFQKTYSQEHLWMAASKKGVSAVGNQYFQKPKAATTFSKNYWKFTRWAFSQLLHRMVFSTESTLKSTLQAPFMILWIRRIKLWRKKNWKMP